MIKRVLLFFLHTGSTVGVQLCLLSVLLKDGGTRGGLYFLAVVLCLADLVGSYPLLKRHDMSRYGYLALQFWDLLLLSPLFLVALVSLFSGGDGFSFGTAALLTDLLLILERSFTFVIFDPKRTHKP